MNSAKRLFPNLKGKSLMQNGDGVLEWLLEWSAWLCRVKHKGLWSRAQGVVVNVRKISRDRRQDLLDGHWHTIRVSNWHEIR